MQGFLSIFGKSLLNTQAKASIRKVLDTLQLWFGKSGQSAPPSAAAVISQTKCRGLLSKRDVIASSLHCLFYKCDEGFQCIISMGIITAEQENVSSENTPLLFSTSLFVGSKVPSGPTDARCYYERPDVLPSSSLDQ